MRHLFLILSIMASLSLPAQNEGVIRQIKLKKINYISFIARYNKERNTIYKDSVFNVEDQFSDCKQSPFKKTGIRIETSDNWKVKSILSQFDTLSTSQLLLSLKGIRGQINFDVYYFDWYNKIDRKEILDLLQLIDNQDVCPFIVNSLIFGSSILYKPTYTVNSTIGYDSMLIIGHSMGVFEFKFQSEYIDSVLTWCMSDQTKEEFKEAWNVKRSSLIE